MFLDPHAINYTLGLEEVEEVQADGSIRKVTKTKEGPTPYETLRMALDDVAFNPVRRVIVQEAEGTLEGYMPDASLLLQPEMTKAV